ncbi:MAG: 2-oxo-hept-4-ene-1,7-dioate hydratase [Aliishimia sp.]
MLSADQIEEAAEALFAAEMTGQQIGLLSARHSDMTIDDAYAVQRALVAKRKATGREIIGWKIGLTSKAMQAALRIDVPDSGILFDDMAFETGSLIPQGRFIEPRVETEIAFILKSDLDGPATHAEVLAATEFVAPALELLDTRIVRLDRTTSMPRKVVDTISDNAANAGIVLGTQRHDPADIDLRHVGAVLMRNGEVEETGLGAGVLNDPVKSVVWLTERLSTYGMSLRRGDIVLSGSFVRPVEAHEGSKFEADFGAFGNVSINFA